MANDGKGHCCYCKSRVECQRPNKVAGRLALMVTRPVILEPFMSIAFDLVGPLPKGKGGKKEEKSICLLTWQQDGQMQFHFAQSQHNK